MTIIFQGHVESLSQSKIGANRVRIRIVPAFASCETPIEIDATREETAGYRPGDSVQIVVTPLAAFVSAKAVRERPEQRDEI